MIEVQPRREGLAVRVVGDHEDARPPARLHLKQKDIPIAQPDRAGVEDAGDIHGKGRDIRDVRPGDDGIRRAALHAFSPSGSPAGETIPASAVRLQLKRRHRG